MAVPLLCGIGKCCRFLANCLLDVQGRGYPQEDIMIVTPWVFSQSLRHESMSFFRLHHDEEDD